MNWLPGAAETGQVLVTPRPVVLLGQARIFGEFVVLDDTGSPNAWSVPVTETLSVRNVSPDVLQGGAVSVIVPVQLSVPLPVGPRVVTATPPCMQGTELIGPPG